MDIRPDALRVKITPTPTPKSIIKTQIEQAETIISKVEGEIKEDTKDCFTRISMYFKKMLYCECESSSNCMKK